MAPPITTGLTSWYDPDDASGVLLDGSGNVETLFDLSGNGVHFTQSNASLRPALIDDGSGHNVLQFSGGQYLVVSGSAISDSLIHINAHTVAVHVRADAEATWRMDGATRGNGIVYWGDNNSGGIAYQRESASSSVPTIVQHRPNSRSGSPSVDSAPITVGAWTTVIAKHSPPASSIRVDLATEATGASVINNAGSDNVQIGRSHLTFGIDHTDATIGRLAFYNVAVDDDDDDELADWLAYVEPASDTEGSSAVTLDDATGEALGEEVHDGASSVVLEDAASNADGSLSVDGSAGTSLDDATGEALGEEKIAASSTVALEEVAASASGEVVAPIVSGSSAVELGEVAASANGAVARAVGGDSDVALEDVGHAASGSHTAPLGTPPESTVSAIAATLTIGRVMLSAELKRRETISGAMPLRTSIAAVFAGKE